MATSSLGEHEAGFLAREHLDDLIRVLRQRSFTVVAPVVCRGVISLQPVESTSQIAQGVVDHQDAGVYGLAASESGVIFDYTLGADGPKRYLFPPRQRLFQMHIEGERFEVDQSAEEAPALAFVGVRPCELAAIATLDRALGADAPATPRCESELHYAQAREKALFIAVNCTRPGGTCFCASMDTGPDARQGFDLALTELRSGFVTRIGSPRGLSLASDLPLRPAESSELELAELKLARAREHMGRRLDTRGLKESLDHCLDPGAWEEVAKRCLACGNCTMVCPTCFCTTVNDSTCLVDSPITRTRQWESCFTDQFTYTTAGPVRNTILSRYRHWLRHKLCTWWDQFGRSGCVGCGRCITWCPVGIDITQQARQVTQPATTMPPVAPVRPGPHAEVRP